MKREGFCRTPPVNTYSRNCRYLLFVRKSNLNPLDTGRTGVVSIWLLSNIYFTIELVSVSGCILDGIALSPSEFPVRVESF